MLCQASCFRSVDSSHLPTRRLSLSTSFSGSWCLTILPRNIFGHPPKSATTPPLLISHPPIHLITAPTHPPSPLESWLVQRNPAATNKNKRCVISDHLSLCVFRNADAHGLDCSASGASESEPQRTISFTSFRTARSCFWIPGRSCFWISGLFFGWLVELRCHLPHGFTSRLAFDGFSLWSGFWIPGWGRFDSWLNYGSGSHGLSGRPECSDPGSALHESAGRPLFFSDGWDCHLRPTRC